LFITLSSQVFNPRSPPSMALDDPINFGPEGHEKLTQIVTISFFWK